MMLDSTIILDLAFLLLAIYMFPGVPLMRTQASGTQSRPQAPITVDGGFNRADTPIPSPVPDVSLMAPSSTIPRIMLTPVASPLIPLPISAPNPGQSPPFGPPRPPVSRPAHKHKSKSVSFSISSLSDILPSSAEREARHRRPPTPWMKGPASPSEIMSKSTSEESSPMPAAASCNVRKAEAGRAGHEDLGRGSLEINLPDAEVDLDGHPGPSPKMCTRDLVDPMGVKKAWLM